MESGAEKSVRVCAFKEDLTRECKGCLAIGQVISITIRRAAERGGLRKMFGGTFQQIEKPGGDAASRRAQGLSNL